MAFDIYIYIYIYVDINLYAPPPQNLKLALQHFAREGSSDHCYADAVPASSGTHTIALVILPWIIIQNHVRRVWWDRLTLWWILFGAWFYLIQLGTDRDIGSDLGCDLVSAICGTSTDTIEDCYNWPAWQRQSVAPWEAFADLYSCLGRLKWHMGSGPLSMAIARTVLNLEKGGRFSSLHYRAIISIETVHATLLAYKWLWKRSSYLKRLLPSCAGRRLWKKYYTCYKALSLVKRCVCFLQTISRKVCLGEISTLPNKSLKSLMRSFDFVMKSFRCLILPDFAISQRSSGKTETLAAISAAISCQPFVVQVQAR